MSAIKCARNVLIFSILFVTDLHFLEKEVKAFLQLPQIEEVLKGHLLSISKICMLFKALKVLRLLPARGNRQAIRNSEPQFNAMASSVK